jgi:hypothetical protein
MSEQRITCAGQVPGRASGVGASSVLAQLGPCAALVDAGVRMDSGDRLPDLAMLEQVQPPCVFVTHAHADHIGALPLVHEAFPDIPMHTSMATTRLMAVLLADATRVMARRAQEEMELPLYDEDLVARTLQRFRPVPASGSFTVPELPQMIVHTAHAGHIAGAVSVGLGSPAPARSTSPSMRPAQIEMVLRVAGLACLADTERFEREGGWRLVLGGAWMSSPRPGWAARGRMAGIPGPGTSRP